MCVGVVWMRTEPALWAAAQPNLLATSLARLLLAVSMLGLLLAVPLLIMLHGAPAEGFSFWCSLPTGCPNYSKKRLQKSPRGPKIYLNLPGRRSSGDPKTTRYRVLTS